MVSPAGKTSVNETLLKAVVLGFVSVNVNVLVLPVVMLAGEKLLERLGTMGSAHPVMVTSSRNIVAVVVPAPGPLYCAPTPITLKSTVPVLVVVAAIPVCQALPVLIVPVPPLVQLTPSVL